MKPDWDKLSEHYNDKSNVVISTLHSEKNHDIVRKFGIRSFPTIVQFTPKKTMYKYEFSGNRSYQNLMSWIDGNVELEQQNEES